jgi:hypothetical protein
MINGFLGFDEIKVKNRILKDKIFLIFFAFVLSGLFFNAVGIVDFGHVCP